jgi:hypothetical protein
MNIPEFRAFINAELDKAEAEHGPIPVVMWYHDKMLSVHTPTLITVRTDMYTGPDNKWNESNGTVFILGE